MNNLFRWRNCLRGFRWSYQLNASTKLLGRNVLYKILWPCHFNHTKHSHLPCTYQHLCSFMYFLSSCLFHILFILFFQSRIAAHSSACAPITIMVVVIILLINQFGLKFRVWQKVTLLPQRFLFLMPKWSSKLIFESCYLFRI